MIFTGTKDNGKHKMNNEQMNLKGKVRLIFTDVATGKQEITEWKNNIITTAGKIAILRRLKNAGSKANEGVITYGAVGTGTTTPAITDTTLATEVARALVSNSIISGLELTLRVFFSQSEANTTLKEFGWFGEDADGSVDTGTLFNRIQIDKEKDSSKTLTIEQTIEFL